MTRVTCGTIVHDGGGRLLLGQATGSRRWDIPKGLAEPGETQLAAAVRELREESGLEADPAALVALGVHDYLPGKRLALFAWQPAAMPDPAGLRCSSLFQFRDGRWLPEIARFAVVPQTEAIGMVGKNMARILAGVRLPARA